MVGMKGRRFSEGGSPEKTITRKSTKVLLEKRERTGLDDEKDDEKPSLTVQKNHTLWTCRTGFAPWLFHLLPILSNPFWALVVSYIKWE